jgi:SAM-dependent methyltransferase
VKPPTSTTSAAFFEQMYATSDDPWDFAHSGYEQSRYDAILAALDRPLYNRAFEPACSIGEFTRRLAPRCGHVDAIDISSTAIALAKQRCCDFPQVTFHIGALPHQIPDGQFDLIVFSEVGYYFSEDILIQLAATLVDRIPSGGCLVAAHWLGTSEDHVLRGDRVHEILAETGGLRPTLNSRHSAFRLDRWTRI